MLHVLAADIIVGTCPLFLGIGALFSLFLSFLTDDSCFPCCCCCCFSKFVLLASKLGDENSLWFFTNPWKRFLSPSDVLKFCRSLQCCSSVLWCCLLILQCSLIRIRAFSLQLQRQAFLLIEATRIYTAEVRSKTEKRLLCALHVSLPVSALKFANPFRLFRFLIETLERFTSKKFIRFQVSFMINFHFTDNQRTRIFQRYECEKGQ